MRNVRSSVRVRSSVVHVRLAIGRVVSSVLCAAMANQSSKLTQDTERKAKSAPLYNTIDGAGREQYVSVLVVSLGVARRQSCMYVM